MEKKLKGTTLIYDAAEEKYLQTQIYMSDDPAETVELCVVDDEHPKFSDGEIDDSSGPWRRIIEPAKDQSSAKATTGEPSSKTPVSKTPVSKTPVSKQEEPLVLEKKHRKAAPVRRRTPTKVLPDPNSQSKPAGKMPNKPVWVRFEAEVLEEDALLRVPDRLHLLAKASGDKVEVRMRLIPNEKSRGATDTLEGLPTIGRD
jgi:hypothetical protein